MRSKDYGLQNRKLPKAAILLHSRGTKGILCGDLLHSKLQPGVSRRLTQPNVFAMGG